MYVVSSKQDLRPENNAIIDNIQQIADAVQKSL